MSERAEFLARWSAQHGGYDPARSRLTSAWLRVMYALTGPLVRLRVHPHAVTLTALPLAYGAFAAAASGLPVLAAALVAVSGVCDGLDGTLALRTGRASRAGALLDAVADRAADGAYLLALWAAGGRAAWCVGAGAALAGLEYVRARAGALGMADVGVVTVGERPTRVFVAAAFLAAGRPTAGALVTLAVSVVGLAQLAPAVTRYVRG